MGGLHSNQQFVRTLYNNSDDGSSVILFLEKFSVCNVVFVLMDLNIILAPLLVKLLPDMSSSCNELLFLSSHKWLPLHHLLIYSCLSQV